MFGDAGPDHVWLATRSIYQGPIPTSVPEDEDDDTKDRWEASEHALRSKSGGEPPDRRQPMGTEQRRIRDEAIVRARLSGTPAVAVAERFGVTTRQVRRVMEKHRAGSFGSAPAAIEAAEEGVAEINRQIEQAQEASGAAETPREKWKATMAIVDLHDKRISIYRQAGLLTPGAIATSAEVSYASRVDLLTTINSAIRKALEGHGIGGEIIDDVTDHAVAASGVDVSGDRQNSEVRTLSRHGHVRFTTAQGNHAAAEEVTNRSNRPI